MIDIFYPLEPEACEARAGGELGDAAFFGPFSADRTVISNIRRETPRSFVFHVPTGDGPRAGRALRAFLQRSWTVAHLLDIAGSDDAVAYYLEQLGDFAGYVRTRRRTRDPIPPESPWVSAATVLSYGPDERVPDEPMSLLVRERDRLNTIDREFELFESGYAAALAIVAMGGVDGMPARRELRCDLSEWQVRAGSGIADMRAGRVDDDGDGDGDGDEGGDDDDDEAH